VAVALRPGPGTRPERPRRRDHAADHCRPSAALLDAGFDPATLTKADGSAAIEALKAKIAEAAAPEIKPKIKNPGEPASKAQWGKARGLLKDLGFAEREAQDGEIERLGYDPQALTKGQASALIEALAARKAEIESKTEPLPGIDTTLRDEIVRLGREGFGWDADKAKAMALKKAEALARERGDKALPKIFDDISGADLQAIVKAMQDVIAKPDPALTAPARTPKPTRRTKTAQLA